MFYVERTDGNGTWTTLMAGPHRLGLDDVRGPPNADNKNYQNTGTAAHPPANSPWNKSAFAGLKGWQARVRYKDMVVERYEWAMVPINELDPDNSGWLWGWKLVERNAPPPIPLEEQLPDWAFQG